MKRPSEALPLPTAYYDKANGGYWFQDSKGTWMRLKEGDLIRFLKDYGYSGKPANGDELSAAARAIMDIQMQQNVDYAGSLAGHAQGLISMEGKSVLVTDSPTIIEPVAGEFPTIHAMLLGMFGEVQLPYFQAWMKLAYESLSSKNLRPGHAVVMAGPRAAGKSLVQKIITKVLGGRAAHPYLSMIGGTSFNSELFGAEHLIIDDQCGSSDFKSRQKLTAEFKMITAAGSQHCHPKNKTALTLTPFWRLTVSVNDDPESLLVLPLIREDLEDKVMLFKVVQREMPMPTKTNAERDAFWNLLMAELPHWLDHLKNWEIPPALVADRFGVKHYHNADIVEAIEGLSPETKLFNMLETFFRGHPNGWRGTAMELETLLTADAAGCQYEARKLFSYPNACARYLERLSRRFGGVIRRDGRENNRHYWRIDFRAGDNDQNSCPFIGPEVMAVAA